MMENQARGLPGVGRKYEGPRLELSGGGSALGRMGAILEYQWDSLRNKYGSGRNEES